jgi:hypothetical protein
MKRRKSDLTASELQAIRKARTKKREQELRDLLDSEFSGAVVWDRRSDWMYSLRTASAQIYYHINTGDVMAYGSLLKSNIEPSEVLTYLMELSSWTKRA